MRHFITPFILGLMGFLALNSAVLRAQERPAEEGTTADGRAKRTLKLPGTVDDLVIGGSGKFVIAHLKNVQKLAIIDVKQAKVVKYLPVSSPDVLFAAGAEKLYLVLPDQSIIQRWSLASFEREVSAPLPSGLTPGVMAMGYAALGPILLGSGPETHSGKPTLLDGKTLQPLADSAAANGRGFECYNGCIVRASANGKVFTSWRTGTSPSGFYTLIVGAGPPETHYEHETLGLLLPGADGARIYTSGGIFNNKAKAVSAGSGRPRASDSLLLPSVTGDYYLRVSNAMYGRSLDERRPVPISFHLAGDSRPIVTLNNVLPQRERQLGNSGVKLYPDKRILHFPDLSALVLLQAADDAFDIVSLDLDAELEKSGIDFLFATSQPPLSAEPGKKLDYQVAVKSKKGGVKVSLSSGPEGMQVTPAGKVTWSVPADQRGDVDVILSIADSSGQEVFQTFRLSFGESRGPATAGAASTAGKTAKAKSLPMNTAAAQAAKAVADSTQQAVGGNPPPASAGDTAALNVKLPPLTPAKLTGDTMTIKLPAAAEKAAVGGGGRYLILHLKSLRKLAVLDVVEAKIIGYIAADDDNISFAAGAEKLIVVLGDKNILTRWNLATQQRELTVPLESPVRSVSMGSASAGPIVVMLGSGDRFPGGGGGFKLYDLAKLRPIEAALPQNFYFGTESNLPARVSADGRTICLPGSQSVATFDGQRLSLTNPRSPENMGMAGGNLIPSPDGQVIYGNSVRFSAQMRPLNKPDGSQQTVFVPSTHGQFYLAVQILRSYYNGDKIIKSKIAVHIDGDARPLVQLDNLPVAGTEQDLYGQSPIPLHNRLVLVPDAKVIASLLDTFDAVELRRFDLDAALEASDIDYLFVTSRAPGSVKPKETVKYQIAVKSKKGGVKYRLESGPEGMTLSPQGLVTWTVPDATKADVQQTVIVAVSDSADQEVFHTFQLTVEGAKPPPPAVASSPPRPGFGGFGTGGLGNPIRPANPENNPIDASPPSPVPIAKSKPLPSAASKPASPYAALVGKTRTWTEAASGRTLEATFVGVEDGKVKATREGGIEISIPLDRLSREDLLWLLGVAPK